MIILLVAATTVIVCLSQSVCLRVSVCFCRCIYLSVSLISVNAPFERLLSNFCETWGVSWWCGHTENKIPPPSLRGFYKMFDKSRHLGPFTLFGNLMSLPLMINTLARLFALMDQTCRRRYFVVECTQLLTLYCFELLQMAPPAIQTQDVVFAYSLVCIFAGCRCWSICITLYHSMFW